IRARARDFPFADEIFRTWILRRNSSDRQGRDGQGHRDTHISPSGVRERLRVLGPEVQGLLTYPHSVSVRVVLTSWGSYGDLYPYLGLAVRLKALGHAPVLATCPLHRPVVEAAGVPFH